eukprot:9369017-Alexandrium_andersonii.AAC.1
MSASLVGSEMCIRDRSSSPLGVSSPTMWACLGDSAASPGKTSSTSSGSVSYTHLTLPTICSV